MVLHLRLHVESSSSTFQLPADGSTIIGRNADCPITCQNQAISGKHCIIHCRKSGTAAVEDISTNGTFLNGVRLKQGQQQELKLGDCVVLAAPKGPLSFELLSDAPEQPPSASQALASHLRRLSPQPSSPATATERLRGRPSTKSEGGELARASSSRATEQGAQPHAASRQSLPSQAGESTLRPALAAQPTPLDLDVEAALPRAAPSKPSRVGDWEADRTSPSRGKRRKLPETPADLTGQALLQWLLKRHVERGSSPTQATKAIKGPASSSVTDAEFGMRSRALARAGRNAKNLLQEQLKRFKELCESQFADPEADFELSVEPPKSLATRAQRRNQKSSPLHPEGAIQVLTSTSLSGDAGLAAASTDAWDRIRGKVLLEANRAQRRAAKAAKAKARLLPVWRSYEICEELRAFDQTLQQLRRRCELEPGRRVLMRQLGAQPKAGLFEDPPQGSQMASAALNAVLSGSLPASSTGNELEAATFLPSRSKRSLVEMINQARPDLIGTWQGTATHSLPAATCKDVLLCIRLFRETCVGSSSTFAGRMAREGLTEDQPLAPSGGQEHCFCNLCSEWLPRSNSKSHQCQAHVGKPRASQAGLKLFRQAWDGLELRLAFQHRGHAQVEISCDMDLQSALKRLLWPQAWEPIRVSSRWRLTAENSQSSQSSLGDLSLKMPVDCLPQQPTRFLLSSAQLALLGWMRERENSSVFQSRQTIRQSICETDLAFELELELQYPLRGGLVLTRGQQSGDAGDEDLCFDRNVATSVLALVDEEAYGAPPEPWEPLLNSRRCRIESSATLIITQQQSLQHWQQALEAASGPARVQVLMITNQRKMRSLTVTEVVEADLILVSTQLFSSEAYQRHFDSLSKPGLQVWDTSSLQLRKEPEAEADASPVPDELFHGEEASFEQGDLVRIHGLIAKAHLNGRQGQLIGWQEDTGRWSCLLAASKSSNVAWKRTRMKKDVRDRKKLGGRPESQLINVRPCNLRAVQPGAKRITVAKRRVVESPLKVSRYYSELRAREDYMARRQVELERHTLRLMRQAVSTGLSAACEEPVGDPAASNDEAVPEGIVQKVQFPLLASAASEVAGSPALLEMFRFRRLVLDDCHLLARPLGQLVSSPGSYGGGLNQYLAKVAPLYSVHAIEAHMRWGIAPFRSVSCAETEGPSEDVAPMASLLGIQIPWGSSREAKRFLESYAAAQETDFESAGAQRMGGARLERCHASAREQTHFVDFSVGERLVYLFRRLEQRLAARCKTESRSKKATAPSDEQARVLLRLCNTADETTWPSPQNYEDYGSEMARLLFDHVVSHWKSKSADAVLADAQQTDFELRLHTFKTLGTSVPGYEREVLLACAHSSVEQLKILVAEHGQFSDPVEARLRRLAQAAVEGEQPAKRMAVDRKQGPPIGEACSQHRPSRSGCSSCNQITESRETLQRLRLAHSRAVVAERRAAQRLRCLGILGALSTPPEIDSRRCCVACSEDAGELLLFPCGHTAHGACLSQIHGRCPECHLAMEAEEAVLLSSLQPAGLPKLEPSPCRFSSKVAAVAVELRRILTQEGQAAQCMVFAQWPAATLQLEEALIEEGITPTVPQAETTDKREEADARIVLFPPEFFQTLGIASTPAFWRARLLAPCSVRHILLMHPLHAAPAKRQTWERRILDLARTESVGLAPAVVLHRFAVRGTVEEDLVKSAT